MAAYDDLNVKGIFIATVISIVVVAVTALAVQVVSYSMLQIQLTEKSELSDYSRQNRVLAEQREKIDNYGVDPATGNITIPIDEAIKLVVEDGGPKESNDESGSANES